MRLSLREAIEDPSVDTAITLTNSLIDKSQDNFIWNLLSLFLCFLNLDFDWWVSLCLFCKEFLRADQDEAERLGSNLSLGRLTGTWWSDKDDLWWASWGIGSESDSEHTGQVVGNIILSLVRSIALVDELIEGLDDSILVHLIFIVNFVGYSIGLFSINLLTR